MLVGVAAVTSAIALMEPMTAWVEQQFGIKRFKAALISVTSVWLLSLAVLFSFSYLSEFTLWEMNLFEQVSALTTYILIPLVALGVMLFVGWVLARRITQDQLSLSLLYYYSWRISLRYLVPLVIGLIFVSNLYNVSF
ncbi:MAG: hypothetical protein LRY63_03990 [Nitrincola sp.]|nr:hypothetical protein [Nitrincola sp.]